MPTINQQYSWYQEKKNNLALLLKESSDVINELAMPQYALKLQQLGQKVSSDTFKVQIVGTFKNGKSTFINALLGEDILPTRVLPCTAVVNEIKYGEKKRAVLNFRSPLPDTLIDCIPDATMAHMKKHGMKDIPPMEIEYDHIDDYVTIPVDGDPEEISKASPYLSVELYYPSPLLKEGVEIIDSPGLNEADERTKCTLDYLDKADAIIYLLDATRPCAKDEMETIEDILIPKGFNEMFFVVNKFDLTPIRERDDIKKFIEKKVGSFSSNQIYFVSALEGLEGKLDHDDNRISASGMAAFEKRLSDFLTKDKGRIKLAQPARELNNILSQEALYRAIPSQRQQLATSLSTLQARYVAVQPQLEELESRKNLMYQQILLRIERSKSEVKRAIIGQFKDTINHVPTWIENYTPSNSIGFASKKKVQIVADEIAQHVSEEIKAHFKEWNEQALIPLVEEKAAYVFESSDKDLAGIFSSIDEITAQVSGQQVQVNGASGWERAAGIVGLCFGYASGAYVMINGFDLKGILSTLAVDLGVGTGLLLLGIANPVIAIAAAVVVVWNAIVLGKGGALEKLKSKISDEICTSIAEKHDEIAEESLKKMCEEFTKIADNAAAAVDIQIQGVKSQVESIIKDKEEGEAAATKRAQVINNCEIKLQRICQELSALVFELAGLSAA